MKEARELAQKEQQELKEEQVKIREQRTKLEVEEEQGFKKSKKRRMIQYYEPKGDFTNCKIRITSVSKMAQQEKGRQLNELIELTDPLNKRIEEILKAKGEVSSLT